MAESNPPIIPDTNLLREVGQITNGRLIHDRNAWSYTYEYWCQKGDRAIAEKYEKKLRQLILADKSL